MKEYTLPDGWKYVPLGTIADVINGVSFKPEDVKKQGIRILRSGNIQNGYLVLKDDDVFLDDSYYNEKNTLRYLDNCITASTGSIEVLGKCGTVFKEMPNCQIGAFMRLVRSKAKENAFYISFILHSPLYYQYIRRLSKNGTSINNINNNHLEDFIFPLPPQKLKEGISRWYYSIEKKISLNTRMNAELEAMAKQLYDYWFVQFDFPDENGKPYKSSGGKMVWNEKLKREIPEGWEVKTLSNILILEDYRRVPLSNKERENKKGPFPYYGATGIMDYIDEYIFDGDYLLLAEDGSTSDENGHPVIQYIWGKNWVNNHAHIITLNNKSWLEYYYFLLKTIPVVLIETGSIQKKINQENLMSYNVIFPPDKLIESFCDITNTLREQQKQVTDEKNYLTHLRDSLLPMLMNGQVGVNE